VTEGQHQHGGRCSRDCASSIFVLAYLMWVQVCAGARNIKSVRVIVNTPPPLSPGRHKIRRLFYP